MVRGGCSRTVHDWLDRHNRTHHPLWPCPWSGPWRVLAPYCFHHGARWTWAALHPLSGQQGCCCRSSDGRPGFERLSNHGGRPLTNGECEPPSGSGRRRRRAKQGQNEMAASWQARSQTERGHSGRALSGRQREITTYICLSLGTNSSLLSLKSVGRLEAAFFSPSQAAPCWSEKHGGYFERG